LPETPAPDTELDHSDVGDDVQRRFYYQNCYAAIISCALLQKGLEVTDVYCEHHDDVLVKFKDEKFEAIQVKTRALHLPGFLFSDEQIQHTIGKFIVLEQKYPDLFKSFKIVSNAAFQLKIGNDFRTIIGHAKADEVDILLKNRSISKKCIQELAKTFKCKPDFIIAVLKKIQLRDQFASLNDKRKTIIEELSKVPGFADERLGTLTAIANNLILLCFNAASKNGEDLAESFLLGKNVEKEVFSAVLEGKRITLSKVQKIIDETRRGNVSHFLKDEKSIGIKISGSSVLEKKLDAGGIDNANINLIKDLKYSFEAFTAQWVHQLEQKEAVERFNQLQLIVHSECQEIFDTCKTDEELFGEDMLQKVRARLRDRIQNDGHLFPDCSYEHLVGMAAVLTEDCRVWWSKKFQI
jgi:hypothetical protein